MLGKVVLTLCLTIGVNTSLCTGGLFAFIADSVQAMTVHADDTMTPAGVGYLSCEDLESSSDSTVSSTSHGCKDAKACVAEATAEAVAKLHVSFHTVATAFAPSHVSELNTISRGVTYRNPISPHPTSGFLAYLVVQRE